MLAAESYTQEILRSLGFILAIDNCARNCRHCPAFSSTEPVIRASFDTMTNRLQSVRSARHRFGSTSEPLKSVHCWRISDPLDYSARLGHGAVATIADVARLWKETLDQGLYVVTNGSEGRRTARAALVEFSQHPEIVSQLKLTITPCDQSWGTDTYIAQLAEDLRIVESLWNLPATRNASAGSRRLRLNVKTTDGDADNAREVTVAILERAGLSDTAIRAALADPHMIAFKPVYDLGTATGSASPVAGAINITDTSGARSKATPRERTKHQYGIRPDGRLFIVDMYAFTEANLTDTDNGAQLYWDDLRGCATSIPPTGTAGQ